MAHTVPYSLFTEFDVNLFKSGKHYKLYEKFGSHLVTHKDKTGVYFAVWAPSADRVSVVGDFNYWNPNENILNVRWDKSGIWEGFVEHAQIGHNYKYCIHSSINNSIIEKSDPYAIFSEIRPKTASKIHTLNYQWGDQNWMAYRKNKNNLDKPYTIYEVHLGSWMKKENNQFLTYHELAEKLVDYVKKMGYTHVEFMPIMEHPYDPSWGYQITGYYAPTSRFGSPEGLMYLIDQFHQADIGVILDWVPSHFPEDKHGLSLFDGSALYEHPDKQKGFHPDWKSLIFNYGRNEVRSFLISNAIYWLEQYHVDGLRVDAVASMLYLDYSRKEGEWSPNIFGGRENLEAISFLKEFNQVVYDNFNDVQTIAEESTSFPMVTKPVYLGGLGFGMKWMMGWMNDTLAYFSKEAIHRTFHQGNLTFSLVYAFTENFMQPLSHDEVVHGKKSIVENMPGDQWQKFANLRLLYGYMYAHPGANLLFMGNDIGQYDEWDFDHSTQWDLLKYPIHNSLNTFVRTLNHFYKNEPAFYEKQFSPDGFEWIILDDSQNSIIAFLRKGHDKPNDLIVCCNFTPVVRNDYRIGLHYGGTIKEIFNSDALDFGGSGIKNNTLINVENIPWNNKHNSANICLPPLSVIIFKYTNR